MILQPSREAFAVMTTIRMPGETEALCFGSFLTCSCMQVSLFNSEVAGQDGHWPKISVSIRPILIAAGAPDALSGNWKEVPWGGL